MLANRSPMSMAEQGPGRMTYAKKRPFAEHDLRVTLQRAGNEHNGMPCGKINVGTVSVKWSMQRTGVLPLSYWET